MVMAIHTPKNPRLNHRPSTYDSATRHTHIDTMLTTIVNFASPAARRAFGSAKLGGHQSVHTQL